MGLKYPSVIAKVLWDYMSESINRTAFVRPDYNMSSKLDWFTLGKKNVWEKTKKGPHFNASLCLLHNQ